MRKRTWFLAGALAACLVAVSLAVRWVFFPPDLRSARDRPSFNTNSDPAAVRLERCPVEWIPPGTVIGDGVPEGWTHLIHYATLRLSEEDQRDAPPLATFYLPLFRFVLLAKVEKGAQSHVLKTVACGYVVNIKGTETIIDSQHTLGADLGVFGKRILAGTEKLFETDFLQVVQTPTMRIIDDREMVRRGTEHVLMILRYAILASPRTGQVRTFVWLLSEKGKEYVLAEPEMQLLPDGYREKYLVSVKREKLGLLGMPAADAVARQTIPQGQGVAFTPRLRELAALKDFTREQALELEQALHDAALASQER
jgi:hypothetical protein